MGRLIFLTLGIVCASCLDPTQITVNITTNYACADTNTGILVGGKQVLAGGSFTATKEKCLSDHEVGSMVVVPSGNLSEDVYLRVLAGVDGTKPDACITSSPPPGSNCIEARRILRFVAHRMLELPVELDRSCINIRCADRETCVKGKCANAVVTDPSCIADPSTCPDAAPPADSGVDSPAPVVTARLVAAGFDQACAVRASDGALICWGKTKPTVVALPVQLGPIKHVAIGAQHTCASDGAKVACWGADTKGQLGGAQPVNLGTGIVVGGLIAGETFTCILDVTKPTHATRCWGAVLDDAQRPNEKLIYQLGSPIAADPGFEAIVAGSRHICGYVLPVGSPTLHCWGDNLQHQSNAGSTSTSFYKPSVVSTLPITLIGAGFDHSGAGGPTPDGNGNRTLAWGGGLMFQLMTVPDQIVFGEQMLCIREGGSVRCANGTNIGLTTVAFPDPPASIAAGRAFVCELAGTGRVYCNGSLSAYPMTKIPYEIMLPP